MSPSRQPFEVDTSTVVHDAIATLREFGIVSFYAKFVRGSRASVVWSFRRLRCRCISQSSCMAPYIIVRFSALLSNLGLFSCTRLGQRRDTIILPFQANGGSPLMLHASLMTGYELHSYLHSLRSSVQISASSLSLTLLLHILSTTFAAVPTFCHWLPRWRCQYR